MQLLLALLAASAPAEPAGYEDRLERWGLLQVGRERDPRPEGKWVEEVLIASEEIVAEGDPYPQILNRAHVRTRPEVIRRELLLGAGEPFREVLAQESERVLRRMWIFATARVLAVRGSAPDRVALLVVTRDLWSIRFNSSFSLVGEVLQYLKLRPTEQNFLGLDKQVSLDLELRLDTLAVGQAFHDRRVFATPFGFYERAAIILGRESGRPEGSAGEWRLYRELVSFEDEWALQLAGSWRVDRHREYRGAEVWTLPYPGASPGESQVPWIFDARELTGEAKVGRSFGSSHKATLFAALGGYARDYRAPGDLGLGEAQRAWLEAEHLPRSEAATYLALGAHLFEARYARVTDVETFALTEDHRLGHTAWLQLRWAAPWLLSPTRFVEGEALLRWRWRFGEDLLTAAAAGAARWMPGAQGGGLVNRRLAMEVENVSPPWGPGRLVARGSFDAVAFDLDRRPVTLGGGNGLRGLAADTLSSGRKRLLWNLEYRTRPLVWQTLHLGAVLFWDAGAVFDREPRVVHTAGIGLRALFPQFDREPIRIDLGFVLDGPAVSGLDRLSASFGQVTEHRPPLLDRRL